MSKQTRDAARRIVAEVFATQADGDLPAGAAGTGSEQPSAADTAPSESEDTATRQRARAIVAAVFDPPATSAEPDPGATPAPEPASAPEPGPERAPEPKPAPELEPAIEPAPMTAARRRALELVAAAEAAQALRAHPEPEEPEPAPVGQAEVPGPATLGPVETVDLEPEVAPESEPLPDPEPDVALEPEPLPDPEPDPLPGPGPVSPAVTAEQSPRSAVEPSTGPDTEDALFGAVGRQEPAEDRLFAWLEPGEGGDRPSQPGEVVVAPDGPPAPPQQGEGGDRSSPPGEVDVAPDGPPAPPAEVDVAPPVPAVPAAAPPRPDLTARLVSEVLEERSAQAHGPVADRRREEQLTQQVAQQEPRRAGRWVLVTAIAAITLALLIPLAIAAVRELLILS